MSTTSFVKSFKSKVPVGIIKLLSIPHKAIFKSSKSFKMCEVWVFQLQKGVLQIDYNNISLLP